MTHTALPRSGAFHLRPEGNASAERATKKHNRPPRSAAFDISLTRCVPRGQLLYNNTFTFSSSASTVKVNVVSIVYSDNCGDKDNDYFDIKYMFSDILSIFVLSSLK
ncbi:hypothetical protein EVAR_94938_1 [Eumeta japonica]|uniref:Uncharacterized protein n=1 Tax=Eumeta variegata TaxID=151549 RepID=A0A4C1TPS4_EUMVA|nr:hypothetical protein EVAR_94938_1 [Eumeta japonica]